MQYESGHLSAQQVLFLVDGELSAVEFSRADEHLRLCAVCRDKLAQTKMTLEELKKLHLNQPSHLASIDGPRALLRARLRERQQQATQKLPPRSLLLYSAATFLVLTAGIVVVGYRMVHRPMEHRSLLDRPVPDSSLTPGAVRSVELTEICPAVDEDLDPPVPDALKQVVFAEYNISERERGKEFQVDYLINPQLGGTTELRNLWPQPYTSTVWNARAKDALEDKLHSMVCNGQISIPQAQHALSRDWIAAYQEYFHTQSPLVSQAGISKLGEDDKNFLP